MEWKKLKFDWKKIGMDKWLLIALAGVLLVMGSFPSSTKNRKEKSEANEKKAETTVVSEDKYINEMEERLCDIIENVEGIGKVKVMITAKSTREKIVLMEEPYSDECSEEYEGDRVTNKKQQISKEQRVIYESSDGKESIPYVVKEEEPEIEGIAVVAQGGGNAQTASKITAIVEALFPVSVHKISVIEMSE